MQVSIMQVSILGFNKNSEHSMWYVSYPVFIEQLKFDVEHLTHLFKLGFMLLKCLLCFCTANFRLRVDTKCIVLDSDVHTTQSSTSLL